MVGRAWTERGELSYGQVLVSGTSDTACTRLRATLNQMARDPSHWRERWRDGERTAKVSVEKKNHGNGWEEATWNDPHLSRQWKGN